MRVALYNRVSTREQNPENQLDQLQDFVGTQAGWEIIPEHIYIDKVSGSGKKVRPQFEKMMLAASQKRFDLILFWKLDRLSREGVRKTLQYLTQLDGWGVAWRSYTEPYFDSCGQFKDVVLSIAATLAQQEIIIRSERTKAGLARAVKGGSILGRKPVRVDVARAKAMQKQGLGLRPIAAKLGCSVNTLRGAL